MGQTLGTKTATLPVCIYNFRSTFDEYGPTQTISYITRNWSTFLGCKQIEPLVSRSQAAQVRARVELDQHRT